MNVRFYRRASAVVGLVLLAVVAQAGSAAAHASLTVTSPTSGEELQGADATITGRVAADGSTTVERVTMTLSLAGRPSTTASASPLAGTVSFPVDLAYNGEYDVTLSMPWRHSAFLNPHDGTATAARSFLVAVPPARPTGVKAAVDDASRAVSITWKANPEPDLIRYEVKRAKGTSTDFTVVARPKAGDTSYLDATTADAGGEYRYLVAAVRNGVPGNEEITSDPSALTTDAVAKVPDPPPPPTTPAPAAPAGAAGAAGTASSVPANSPGALTTPGKADLSGFDTVRRQTSGVTPRTLPLPDPGYQGTLPFPSVGSGEAAGEERAGDVGELAADSPQYRELGADSSSNERARTMAFFAAGLLATVLLMHVLWVKSEVNRVPLEAIDPEGPTPGETWAAAAAKGRRGKRNAAQGPTLDDIAAADFAPVVVAAGPKVRTPRAGAAVPTRRPSAGDRRQKVATGA